MCACWLGWLQQLSPLLGFVTRYCSVWRGAVPSCYCDSWELPAQDFFFSPACCFQLPKLSTIFPPISGFMFCSVCLCVGASSDFRSMHIFKHAVLLHKLVSFMWIQFLKWNLPHFDKIIANAWISTNYEELLRKADFISNKTRFNDLSMALLMCTCHFLCGSRAGS